MKEINNDSTTESIMFRKRFLGLVVVVAGSGSVSLLHAWDDAVNRQDSRQIQSSVQTKIWRTPDHDGANCLYLLMRLSGRAVEYTEVEQALAAQERGNSLVGLREAARRLGLKTAVAKGGLDELTKERLPAIIHLENLQKDVGSFALVFARTDKECHTISGATATIEPIPIDVFRRSWSGYVLRPVPAANGWAISLAGGLVALAGYSWWRLSSARQANRSADGRCQSTA